MAPITLKCCDATNCHNQVLHEIGFEVENCIDSGHLTQSLRVNRDEAHNHICKEHRIWNLVKDVKKFVIPQ